MAFYVVNGEAINLNIVDSFSFIENKEKDKNVYIIKCTRKTCNDSYYCIEKEEMDAILKGEGLWLQKHKFVGY